jgi:hypothetical protein
VDEDKSAELVPATKVETSLDIAATVVSVVPWLGGPVGQVLSGMSIGRKMERVSEVLGGLAQDLKDFKSTVSETYVRSSEFQELLERTLRQAADEHNEEKRRIYRMFLKGAIETPGEPYDEQKRFLRTLEEMQGGHLRVIKAMLQEPETTTGTMGSPLQTLCRRIPELSRGAIAELVGQLNDMRVTNLASLTTMMTAYGAADLRHGLTPYGRRFVSFV